MAEVSAFLVALVIIVLIIAIILIILVYASRNSTSVTNTSTPTVSSCVAPPGMPTGLFLTNPQGDLIVATWNFLAAATSYTVYLGTTPGFATGSALSTKVVTSNSTSFGNLAQGVTYYVKLTASNSCGTSVLSAEGNITIPYNFPPRFAIAYSQNTSLEACWDDNIFLPTYQESASSFCDTNTSWVNFHSNDNTIRLTSDASRCLTRTNGNQIWMNPCVPDSTQTWVYSGTDASLCDPANPTTKCLNISSVTSTGGTLTFGVKGNAAMSGWDILAT